MRDLFEKGLRRLDIFTDTWSLIEVEKGFEIGCWKPYVYVDILHIT